MEPERISACQDETFHPETCLVAIEPVSNFTEIVRSVSDEGRGMAHHVENELGARHSSDVFHVRHEVVKSTGGALAGKNSQGR